jgi:hypothetical protein
MMKEFLGSQVELSKGLRTVRDDGRTGKPEMQMLGEKVSMSSTPVNDFRSEVSEGTMQMLGEKVPMNRTRIAPYDGAPLSIRAEKQQGSGK